MHDSESRRLIRFVDWGMEQEAESMAEKLQTQLFHARDSADKERTGLVERAAKAEAGLTDARTELGMDWSPKMLPL